MCSDSQNSTRKHAAPQRVQLPRLETSAYMNEAARNVSQREEVSHRLGIYIIFEDEGGDVCLLASSQSLVPLRIVGHTYGLL